MQFRRELLTIPVSEIRPWQNNPSVRVMPGQAFEDLKESIRTYGLVDPLTVVPNSDGSYQLVRGHRRLAAAIALGYVTVPCEVWHLPFDQAMEIAASCERTQRPWVGRALAEVFLRHPRELGLRLVGKRDRQVIEAAFDAADDASLVVELLVRWGPRALRVVLRAARLTAEPFDRWARAVLAHGAYRDIEDRTKGLTTAERRETLFTLLAEWEAVSVA